MKNQTMKKNSFLGGAFVSTLAIIIVKIIGIVYVIPFNHLIGDKGGALYGYGYNIYALFLSISSAGFPFAVSKLTSERLSNGSKEDVSQIYKISRNIIFLLSAVMFTALFLLAPFIANVIAAKGTGGNTVADITFVLRIVSLAILVVPFLSVTRGFLQGHKIITPGSISQIIEQLVRVTVILVGCYLALKVFHIGLTWAVGISVFAACVGGLFSLLYLQIKLHQSDLVEKDVKIESKEVVLKIVKQLCLYAVPYVVISAICNLYESIDMVVVQRVLSDIIKLDAPTTESISSVFTLWGGKFNGIILAMIVGLNTSLTPNIVSSYAKKDYKDVNDKANKSLELILYIIVPLTIFISVFTRPLWTFFYGYNPTGISVYRYFVFYALFGGLFTVLVNILQSLSKYKEVVISVLIGLIFNVVFDAPFILLFHHFGWMPAGGAVICGLIAYSLSIAYVIHSLLKDRIVFKETYEQIPKFLLLWIVFIVVLFVTYHFMPTELLGRFIQIPVLGGSFILCFGIYFLVSYKIGVFTNLFHFHFKKKFPFIQMDDH